MLFLDVDLNIHICRSRAKDLETAITQLHKRISLLDRPVGPAPSAPAPLVTQEAALASDRS